MKRLVIIMAGWLAVLQTGTAANYHATHVPTPCLATQDLSPGTDLTNLIVNPDFEIRGGTGWTFVGSSWTNSYGGAYTYTENGQSKTNHCAEVWNADFDLYQDIESDVLQEGLYMVSVHAFQRTAENSIAWTTWLDGSAVVRTYVYLNEFSAPVTNLQAVQYNEKMGYHRDAAIHEEEGSTVYTLDDMTGASRVFTLPDGYTDYRTFGYSGHTDQKPLANFKMNVYGLLAETGHLRIGIRSIDPDNTYDRWSLWDKFELYYMGKDVDGLKFVIADYIKRFNALNADEYSTVEYGNLADEYANTAGYEDIEGTPVYDPNTGAVISYQSDELYDMLIRFVAAYNQCLESKEVLSQLNAKLAELENVLHNHDVGTGPYQEVESFINAHKNSNVGSIEDFNEWMIQADAYIFQLELYVDYIGASYINLPYGTTSILESAFAGFSALTTVYIPSSVTSIGIHAFEGCTNLTTVIINIETPLAIEAETFPNPANITLYVPAGCKSLYEATDYWNQFQIVEFVPSDGSSLSSEVKTNIANYIQRFEALDAEEIGTVEYDELETICNNTNGYENIVGVPIIDPSSGDIIGDHSDELDMMLADLTAAYDLCRESEEVLLQLGEKLVELRSILQNYEGAIDEHFCQEVDNFIALHSGSNHGGINDFNNYIHQADEYLAQLPSYEQKLVISSVQGHPGEEVTVNVSLQYIYNISALQLTIPLDELLTYVEGSATLSNRAADHQATVGVKDGVLTLLVYSLSMTALTGDSGDVLSFRLKLGNQPADIPLTPSRVVLTRKTGSSSEASVESGEVSIRCPKAQYASMTIDYGRVPIRDTYTKTLTIQNVGNEPLEVTSLLFSDVTTFSCEESFPFTVAAGSSKSVVIQYAPTERGSVNETVQVVCNSISKLNTIALKAQPFAVNELHVQETSGVSDEEVTVHLTMNNMDPITGFQFEFNMPDMLKYVEGSFELSDRRVDHTAMTTLNNGVLRSICYSSSNAAFTGNDGEIASFRVRLDGQSGATLEAQKAILTAQINDITTDVLSAKYGAYIRINSPNLSAASSINMGRVPITEECTATLTLSNRGNAPLNISRVIFNDEAFSVEESLPMTIEQRSSKTVTVVYSGVEERDFEGLMQLYTNDPNKRLVNIPVTGNRFAPNYLTVNAHDASLTTDLLVDVNVDNYDAVSGIQFDVTLPTVAVGRKYVPVYLPKADDVRLSSRATGMTVTHRQVDETTVRYFCYFFGSQGISSGTGNVMQLVFEPQEALVTGNYELVVSNITLGTHDLANKYSGENSVSDTLRVDDYLLGDVNGDGLVNIQDVVALISYIIGETPSPFYVSVANINADSTVNVQDVVLLINMIIGN